MPSIEIRPVVDGEWTAISNTIRAALLGQPVTDDLTEKRRGSWEESDGLAAWEGERCVGHVAAFRFVTTVPGGARLPTAGYTRVGVLPTHTRRGLLRTMMEQTMRDAHDRGQVLASLRASEATIYGRFGFGLGGDSTVATITTATALPLRTDPVGGSVRLLDRDELHEVVAPLYDRCAARGVGMIDRPAWVWGIEFERVAEPTEDNQVRGRHVAVHTDEGGVDDAYAHYEVGWDDGFGELPRASGRIHELFATSPEAERAMWEYILGIDLIGTWRVERPVDDPFRRTLADVRAYAVELRWDEQWIRLIDVDAALRARTYAPASGSVVVGVTDPLLDHNAGRWRVSADGAERTDADADVTVDIATISSAYLGGVSWSVLAASGEVAGDVDPSVVATLDTLFTVHPSPFCGTEF